MEWVQVDKGAIRFILSSANIMCPGLTSPGAVMEKELMANTPVAVYAESKAHALAIGILDKDTLEIKAKNEGVGVTNVHHLGDALWII